MVIKSVFYFAGAFVVQALPGVVKLGARWDEKQNRYILSTYKQGSVRRYKHGEKMR